MRVAILLMLIVRLAAAGEVQDEKARTLFQSGQAAFKAEHFEEAYSLFRQAYLISPQPGLLYNMASALQAAGRPHQAAEELRAYLRTQPADNPEREPIEARIRALEEAQRLLDSDQKPSPAPVIATAPPPPPPKKHTTLIVVLSTVGVVVIGGSLGLGLGLGLHDWHTSTTLGNHGATP